MTVRYNYNRQLTPAAPFVHIRIVSYDGRVLAERVPAQIDTGADLTVVPDELADRLNLMPRGEMAVGGFGSGRAVATIYQARIGIHNLPLVPARVVSNVAEPRVLLGRDVLNRHRIVLDGPRATLEIEEA